MSGPVPCSSSRPVSYRARFAEGPVGITAAAIPRDDARSRRPRIPHPRQPESRRAFPPAYPGRDAGERADPRIPASAPVASPMETRMHRIASPRIGLNSRIDDGRVTAHAVVAAPSRQGR